MPSREQVERWRTLVAEGGCSFAPTMADMLERAMRFVIATNVPYADPARREERHQLMREWCGEEANDG